MRESGSPAPPMSRRGALEAGVLIAGTAWVAPVIQPIALSEAAADTISASPSTRGRSPETNAPPDFAGAPLSQAPPANNALGTPGSQNGIAPWIENGDPAGTSGADQSNASGTRAADGSAGPEGISVWGTPGADAR